MTVTNTSQHLQALRAARLVDTRKEGTKVIYRVAGDEVCRFFFALRELAGARLAEVEQFVRRYVESADGYELVGRAELLERARRRGVVVLDVRPPDEYASGHIPGAVSVPLEELEDRLASLPRDAEIVAYCRGPYCLLAPQARRAAARARLPRPPARGRLPRVAPRRAPRRNRNGGTMNVLVLVNDPPYGTERSYNAPPPRRLTRQARREPRCGSS